MTGLIALGMCLIVALFVAYSIGRDDGNPNGRAVSTAAIPDALSGRNVMQKGISRAHSENEIESRLRDTLYTAFKKYPGNVPNSGEPIALMAASIAKIISIKFSPIIFGEVLVDVSKINERFPPDWNIEDASSRWYALGLICLIHCVKRTQWATSLGLDVGFKVYDATNELVWDWWQLPEGTSRRVKAFMRTNISEITESLDTIVNMNARDLWFSRYSERITGRENPPWHIRATDLQDWWRNDPFNGKIGEVLRHNFTDTWKAIERRISGEDAKRILASPLISLATSTKVSVDSPVRSENPVLNNHPSEDRVRELWTIWKEEGEDGLSNHFREQQRNR